MENFQIEEKLDIVDEQDLVIGSIERGEIHSKGLLHREIHVWLFDKNGNIYFQSRGGDPDVPGVLDASVGGHVDLGEDYISAALRETLEETGLRIQKEDLALLQKLRENYTFPTGDKFNNFFRAIFIYKNPINEEDLVLEEGKSSSFKKYSIKDLENLKQEEHSEFYKYILTHEIPFVLDYVKKL